MSADFVGAQAQAAGDSDARKDVVILGSTGSIGTQALDVISRNPDKYRVVGLGAGGGQQELLASQAREFGVQVIAVAGEPGSALTEARGVDGRPLEILFGPTAMAELAKLAGPTGVVLNGITGSVGLLPTLAALESGATLALANKESLVVGGGLIKSAMVRPGQIVPVDSEHSAIAQALRSGRHRKGLTCDEVDGTSEVARIILTASGGPFRGKTRADLSGVTAAQALNHPTWAMGPVVTINSSTLMNKGLELIEAALLFEVEDIVPVVHPQSIIHSMVEFRDGSTIAQASPPDMRLPIALGLSWPERLDDVSRPCDWTQAATWTFEPVDNVTFPAIDLAKAAVATSALHPAVLNAANEECVDAFLNGRIAYLDIVDTVARVLEEFEPGAGVSAGSSAGADGTGAAASGLDVETVLGTELWARARTHEILGR